MAVMMTPVIMAQTDNDTAKVVKCAQEGDDVCQNLLAKWIFEGSHGFVRDYGKAVAWWLQSAKQNNSEATANLGFCYMYGLGVEADSSTASRLFEKALKQGNKKVVDIHDSLAHKGSVFSAMLLGKCYKLARGVARDEKASARYYLMAAKQGNVEAMREAGILKRNAKEDNEALELFREASEKNDVVATYYYGKMLCEGRGTEKDTRKGTIYLRKAADNGLPAAQYELAGAYDKGIGVETDSAQAYHWYSQAAAGGNRAAWWEKAERLRLGKGVEMNYESALDSYIKAYDMGFHNKLKALLSGENPEWKDTPFMCYLRGMRLLTVDNNPNAAMDEFVKLPKQMNLYQTMEAICMLNPAYKKTNVKKAIKILQELASTEQRATYELAMLQLHGTGMDKDVAKAEKELVVLANKGYVRATNFLADCYFEGRIFPQNKEKAILYYLRAEKQQGLTAVGATRLAHAFRNGDGVKADEERAADLEKYKASEVRTLLEMVEK